MITELVTVDRIASHQKVKRNSAPTTYRGGTLGLNIITDSTGPAKAGTSLT